MSYNPNTDPVIIAAQERGRAQGLEFSRKLNAALERMKTAMAQNTQTTQTKPPAPNGGDATESAGDTAVQDIEAPFQLSADDIVEAVEQDRKTIIHNVIRDEKVLFSTVSRPLADAFVFGWNAKTLKDAKTRRTAGAEDSDNSEDATPRNNGVGASQDGRGAAEVDPKEKTADAGNRAKPSPGSLPGSKPGDSGDDSRGTDATPRKRNLL